MLLRHPHRNRHEETSQDPFSLNQVHPLTRRVSEESLARLLKALVRLALTGMGYPGAVLLRHSVHPSLINEEPVRDYAHQLTPLLELLAVAQAGQKCDVYPLFHYQLNEPAV